MNVQFRPAPENTGIVFVRTDLDGQPRVPASVLHRVQGPRRTTLVHDGCAVEMIEHVMAALYGLNIDNCEVHIDRQDVPGVDGSSLPFVTALLAAGREEQSAVRRLTTVNSTIRLGDEDRWILAEPVDHGQLELEYRLNYTCPAIGEQTFNAVHQRNTFVSDIAPARTFLLHSEAKAMREQGLGHRVQFSDLIVFDSGGPIDNTLRFENECARHKLLDMIGDLALIGTDIVGKSTACKTGHFMNAKMVLALREQVESSTSYRKSA